jgi:hypothetical protein
MAKRKRHKKQTGYHWSQVLEELGACEPAIEFARGCRSYGEAIAKLQRNTCGTLGSAELGWRTWLADEIVYRFVQEYGGPYNRAYARWPHRRWPSWRSVLATLRWYRQQIAEAQAEQAEFRARFAS